MSYFLSFMFLLLGLCWSQFASSQIVNIQSALSGQIPLGLGLSAEFTQDNRSGNTNSQSLSGQATSTYRIDKLLFLVIGRREYSKSSGKKVGDSKFGHFRTSYRFAKYFAWEAFVQEDSDPFRRNARRAVYGSGPRFQAKLIGGLRMALSMAYMHEHEEFSPIPEYVPYLQDPEDETSIGYQEILIKEPTRDTERINNTLFLSWRFNKSYLLESTTYFQPEIGYIHHRKVLSESSLLIEVDQSVSFRISHSIAHNSKPAFGVKKEDVSFSQSLVLSF